MPRWKGALAEALPLRGGGEQRAGAASLTRLTGRALRPRPPLPARRPEMAAGPSPPRSGSGVSTA